MRLPGEPLPYQGSCSCGRVQFELAQLPLTYYACHCTDCQHRTGGAMRLAMWVEREALVVRRGEPELRTFELGGRKRNLRICGVCHTHLWGEPETRPKLAVLLATTLHNHLQFEPVAHIWTRSALPWMTFPSGAATYDTQPKDPTELVGLWREKMGRNDGAI